MENVRISATLRSQMRLNAEYPHLFTRLYKFETNYCILLERPQEEFVEIEKDFNHNIKLLHANVKLVNERPSSDFEEVESLDNNRIGENFSALFFTRNDFNAFLNGSIKPVPNVTFGEFDSKTVEIMHEYPINESMKEKIRKKIRPLIFEQEIIFRKLPVSKTVSKTNVNQDKLNYLQIKKRPRLPKFAREDEHKWFENIKPLFEGKETKFDFGFASDSGPSCFVSANPSSVDLRQISLSYSTIFLEMPAFSAEKFWETQTVNTDDLMELIAADKVRLICTVPEEHMDVGLLEQAYSINPNSVVSSRTFSAFLIRDIVRTESDYFFSSRENQQGILSLVDAVAMQSGATPKDIANFLLYPTIALRKCLEPFNRRGVNGLLSFGQGKVFADEFEKATGRDTWFEASTFSRNIHIVHALNATYLPANG